MIATVFGPLLMIVMVAWGILLIFVVLQEIVQSVLRLCEPGALRRATRFRLRSLLLVAAIVQVMFATVAWYQKEARTTVAILFSIGCVAFFGWIIWVAFEENGSRTGSRRWRRVIRDRRIVVPDDGAPPRPARRVKRRAEKSSRDTTN